MKTAVSITINTNGYDSIPSIHAKGSENIGNKQVSYTKLCNDLASLLRSKDRSTTELARLLQVDRCDVQTWLDAAVKLGLANRYGPVLCPVTRRWSMFYSQKSPAHKDVPGNRVEMFDTVIEKLEQQIPKGILKPFATNIYNYIAYGEQPKFTKLEDLAMWEHTIQPIIDGGLK